ncbi:G-protein coupled receptor 182-like [Protopterus annectens]|uniref:G-protein coupled receptor 182-like n=1 Tax=Protopterus annectens TaxID=7888 RepID=UPI001CFB81C8|nr:G-protein coupled receptor 182-like [Protopterus annectens]
MEAEEHDYYLDYTDVQNLTSFFAFLNSSFSTCHVEFNEKHKLVVLFLMYLIIFVVGLTGNVIVIWVNWQLRSTKKFISLYILNMAIADLGVVLTVPIWMLEVILGYTWLWGDFMCKLTHYFYFANMYSSIFFLTCLSIDRYFSLRHPETPWHKHQHHIRISVCAGVWILALVAPIHEVMHMTVVEASEPMCFFLAPFESYKTWGLAVVLVVSILGFGIPFPIIVIFNILTAINICSLSKTERQRHCALISAYIAVFVICWLPFHITVILFALHGTHITLNCYLLHGLYFFYDIIDCISLSHCVANPILYNFLSKNFQNKLRNAVVMYLPKQQGNKDGEASSSTRHSVVIVNHEN